MSSTAMTTISALSDAELDAVAAAGYGVHVRTGNIAVASGSNYQLNFASKGGTSGGSQSVIANSGVFVSL